MRTEHVSWLWVVSALATLAMLSSAACGPKRPPAVLSGGGEAAMERRTPAGEGRHDGEEPGLSGSEIRALSSDAASRDDLATALTGEESSPLADVYFDFDQATLTPEALATLAKHAAWLTAHANARVTVEGHCDERGTVEYNLALGDKRAQAVREQLVSLGISASRLRAVSFGKERPVDTGHDEAAWARNRRAHFAVSR